MNNVAWHENCTLLDEVRRDTLTLDEFAADLDAVRKGKAPNVYQLPDRFFDHTYPTENLKKLVRGVLHRLDGRGGAPVIRVQVAYGGGKTHALIALLHLANGANQLELHSTVQEFMSFSELNQLSQARVALLPFDKFDVIEGLSVLGPDGKPRQLKTPWGALAYQLAGDEGLARVAEHESGYTTPAQPILEDLLRAPRASGLSTLVLIDETLMYMRGAVAADPNRRSILQDFFQGLTQAVRTVDRAALVASVISNDMVADDPISIQCLDALKNVFRRMEETMEPVSGGDIPELLRRRLFEIESVPNLETRRPIVDRVAETLQRLPLTVSLRETSAKERMLASYPFHPDLLDVFYQKWTRLSKFQRTRGVLRMFAIALRDAEGRDTSALVGAGSFLGSDGELSEAVQELIQACEEGNEWTPILHGELDRARRIQADRPRLQKHREIEQAVIATFLHSQPSGQKADETDLYGLLAHAEIDAVSVEDGLAKWREISLFLKENGASWSLDITSNLTKMHIDAMRQLNANDINDETIRRIREARLEQTSDSIAVHPLPDSPADVPDNADLHFVIAPPDHVATAGEPVSAWLEAFFNRTHVNHIIILAADTSRMAGLTTQIRRILGWQGVEREDKINRLTPPQRAQLLQWKRNDEHSVSDSVKSTYCVLIALDEEGDIEARQLPPGTEPAFERVKKFVEDEERLLTTSLDPDLLTPDSDFKLWNDDETSKPVPRLYSMFASLPRLPKLLSRQVFVDTLRRGVKEGRIVLRDVRPNGSQHTYWRESASDEDLSKKGLEIVPVEHAELHNLDPELLRPGALPELWQHAEFPIPVSVVREFFDRDEVPQLASALVLYEAVAEAIVAGVVMGRSRSHDYFREDVIGDEIDGDWELLPPPAPIRGSEITPRALSKAWEEETPTVGKVWSELARQRGAKPPWTLIKDAVNQGVDAGLFEVTTANWPCSPHEADSVGLRESDEPVRLEPREVAEAIPDTSGFVTLAYIKETLESEKGAPISDGIFRGAVNDALNRKLIVSEGPAVDDYYETRVRQPDWVGHSESRLTEAEVQDLAERIGSLSEIAPELEFEFRLVVTAEGDRPSDEVLKELDEVLGGVRDSLRFGLDGS